MGINVSKSKQFSEQLETTVEPELYAKVEAAAAEEDRSKAAIVRRAIRAYFQDEEAAA